MNTKINEILQEIESVIVGKNEIVEKILMAILAQGHVLMEDVPGVGKTTTAMLSQKSLGWRRAVCSSRRTPCRRTSSASRSMTKRQTNLFTNPVRS